MARFVIADDSIVMQTILQFMLEKCGHSIAGVARNGLEAVDLFKKHQPDALALDIMMRGGDGLTALKAIKQLQPAATIIMIAEEGQDKEADECLAAGAVGILRKPFILGQVSAELERVFGGKGNN